VKFAITLAHRNVGLSESSKLFIASRLVLKSGILDPAIGGTVLRAGSVGASDNIRTEDMVVDFWLETGR